MARNCIRRMSRVEQLLGDNLPAPYLAAEARVLLSNVHDGRFRAWCALTWRWTYDAVRRTWFDTILWLGDRLGFTWVDAHGVRHSRKCPGGENCRLDCLLPANWTIEVITPGEELQQEKKVEPWTN